MVYPHFLKFLCNVESENVFPLLAKEFGCRLQATPGQAKEEATEGEKDCVLEMSDLVAG